MIAEQDPDLIHEAAHGGHLDIVRMLLAAGV
jgi:hypothetical protein